MTYNYTFLIVPIASYGPHRKSHCRLLSRRAHFLRNLNLLPPRRKNTASCSPLKAPVWCCPHLQYGKAKTQNRSHLRVSVSQAAQAPRPPQQQNVKSPTWNLAMATRVRCRPRIRRQRGVRRRKGCRRRPRGFNKWPGPTGIEHVLWLARPAEKKLSTPASPRPRLQLLRRQLPKVSLG